MQQDDKRLQTAWKPGQSGNPSGRPKKRPITSVILAALNRPMYPNDRRTMAECFKDRLAQIIMSGEDGHSIAAFKLLLAQVEGLPSQTVTLDWEKAVDDISTRTGAPRMWLVKRAEEITLRHAIEGAREDADDGQGAGVYFQSDINGSEEHTGRARTGRRITGHRKERPTRTG